MKIWKRTWRIIFWEELLFDWKFYSGYYPNYPEYSRIYKYWVVGCFEIRMLFTNEEIEENHNKYFHFD